jgi:tetratricopeptide (TPR) repeat protein
VCGHITDQLQARKSVSRYYHVPPIAVPRFFGRQKLISEIHTFLLKPRGQYDKPNAAVLQALGGQGKSQVALELCRRLRKDCRGVFWLDATSKATLERGLEEIADELNRPAVRRLEDTKSKVRFVLDTIQEWTEQWLIVYDNYDRPDIFPDIKPFLPESKSICAIVIHTLTFIGGQGGIICTSRHAATKVLGRQFQVPSMTNDGGIELLLRDMSSEEIENSRAVGEDIVHRLGGLALAIEQAAAAYISFNQMPLPDFINEYERKKAKVLKHMREELWEYQKIRDGSEKNEAFSAFTTWEMSFEQVEQRDERRREHITRFLAVAAFLEPSHIGSYLFETYLAKDKNTFPWLDIFRRPRSLSDEDTDSDPDSNTDSNTGQASSMRKHKQASWDRDQFWSVIERLHRLSLVQSIKKEPTVIFSLHPVISDWLQLREQKRSTREQILRETIKLMSVVVGSAFAEAAHASTRQELLAHLDSCQTNSEHMKFTKSLGCADMRDETNSFGHFYETQGQYTRSDKLYEALINEDRSKVDGSDKYLAQSMNSLAMSYYEQCRWKEAEELIVQVVEIATRALGEEHLGTLASICNLALVYRKQKQWKKAEELYVQVVETMNRMLGKEHPDTLSSTASLASTYREQGLWKEAEELLVQVVETRTRVLGEEHPDTLHSIRSLAYTYQKQGRWKETEELLVQGVEARKRVLGGEHLDTVTTIYNLGYVYQKQGRWKEAEELLVQVVEIRKRVLGEQHPDTLHSIHSLAYMYQERGRLKEAAEL